MIIDIINEFDESVSDILYNIVVMWILFKGLVNVLVIIFSVEVLIFG